MPLSRPIFAARAGLPDLPACGLAAALAGLAACPPPAAAQAQAENTGDGAGQAARQAPSDPAALNHEGEAEKRARSALKRHLVTTTTSVLDLELRLTRLEETLPRLESEERRAAASLAGRRGRVAGMLAVLQRRARRPAYGPVPAPRDPVDLLRGRSLLAAAMPSLDRDARALAEDLRQLASLRERLDRDRERHHRAVRRLAEERRVLAGLIAIRAGRGAPPATPDEAETAGGDARTSETRTIESLIARLDRARLETRLRPEDLVPGGRRPGAASAAVSIPDAKPAARASRMPASGALVGRFGEPEEHGWTARGVTVKTRPSGQVVAPRAGTVVFAEPFLDYGQLLIIDHGEGYHVLLAGLERLDARVGDDLVSGEPVGVMGSGGGGADRLYIELRRGGRPVDPLPWLTENSDKVGG